jgi:hypothetical protein
MTTRGAVAPVIGTVLTAVLILVALVIGVIVLFVGV